MPNKSEERDQVLNPCLKLCKKLEFAGYILEYRRLDVFDKTHIDGSPDIEIKLAHDGIVFIFMCECKKEDGGIQSDVQKVYEEKYKPYKNVCYQIITSPDQLEYFIKKLADKNIPVLVENEMNEHMGLEPVISKGEDI